VTGGLHHVDLWALLFPDRHPHAGGPDSYAAYLEDAWGYEVELAAD
jgi:hypothetical protein